MSTAATLTAEFTAGVLTSSELRSVLRQDPTLIHHPSAISEADCSAILGAFEGISFEHYSATDGLSDSEPVSKLATTGTLFDFYGEPTGFATYFEQAHSQMAFMRRRFAAAGAPDPLRLMIEMLQGAWVGPVEVATEPGVGIYNAGVVRSIPSGALPHVDNAIEECPSLAVGKIVAQASILIYLTSPSGGGGVRVFHKAPTDDDMAHHRQDWGFSPAAIAGIPFTGVNPTVGDVVLFPTTLIHAVDPVTSGRRISVSAFVGQTSDGRLILWS
jgi:hypothetical protein